MEENKIEMPCPECPPNCPHHSPTCRPICRIWKSWQRDHKAPRPKITVVDGYRNAQHKKACEKLTKGRRRW